MTGPTVAVLFAHRNSVYKGMPCVDVWDEARDARNWPGGLPVKFGGFTLHIDQNWWGHPAAKSTFLYIAGIARRALPEIPIGFCHPTHVIESNRRRRRLGAAGLPYLPKSGREHTPAAFAEWLFQLAQNCRPPSEFSTAE